ALRRGALLRLRRRPLRRAPARGLHESAPGRAEVLGYRRAQGADRARRGRGACATRRALHGRRAEGVAVVALDDIIGRMLSFARSLRAGISEPPEAPPTRDEPIRTRTMARLLASQG